MSHTPPFGRLPVADAPERGPGGASAPASPADGAQTPRDAGPNPLLPKPIQADPSRRGAAVTEAGATDYDALFRRVYPSLFRYLHRLTGDTDAADDMAQEAFVRLLGRRLPEDEARLWLFTVATNLFRDRARMSRRRERILSANPWRPAALPRPDEVLERSRAVDGVRKALDKIAPRDRQMLLMREEGFRYDEIAQAAGVAPGSVGTLLARAARRFAAVYEKHEEKGDEALG